MRTISNSDDVIDSRDVIARIEELEGERDRLEEAEEGPLPDADAEELKALQAFAAEAEGYAPDWNHGAMLIRDDYFDAYMDQMLEDCGDLPKDLPSYVTLTIDYYALQSDYSSAEFDGVTYWVR